MSQYKKHVAAAAAALCAITVQAAVVLPAMDWYRTADNQCLKVDAVNDANLQFVLSGATCKLSTVETADGVKTTNNFRCVLRVTPTDVSGRWGKLQYAGNAISMEGDSSFELNWDGTLLGQRDAKYAEPRLYGRDVNGYCAQHQLNEGLRGPVR